MPIDVANSLLTVLDRNEDLTLSHVLGEEEFGELEIDFYKDISRQHAQHEALAAHSSSSPSFLPANLALSKSEPIIISLLTLEGDAMQSLLKGITSGDYGGRDVPAVKIHNWQGSSPTRQYAHETFWRVLENTSDKDQDMYALFIDYVL